MINQGFPTKYIPVGLTRTDKKKQLQMLKQSQKQYKKRQYKTRKKLPSFHNKKSHHIEKAKKIYKVDAIVPNSQLAKATGCSIDAMNQIVKKGEGAYYSSGSRPNQTPQSWAYARLASSLTAGKAAKVDFDILRRGCHHKKKAFLLAKKIL